MSPSLSWASTVPNCWLGDWINSRLCAQMRLRYDVIRLSLFRALSNRRTRVPLAGVLSPIPHLEAVAQNDRVSHLFAEPFASYSSLGELRNGT
ncbi:unnamed protein product [Penicillium nalgiovense]|nr:unnamed protein product [Penicillium nalgiovense]